MLLIRKRDFLVILKLTVMTVHFFINFTPLLQQPAIITYVEVGILWRSMPELFMVLGVSESVFRCCLCYVVFWICIHHWHKPVMTACPISSKQPPKVLLKKSCLMCSSLPTQRWKNCWCWCVSRRYVATKRIFINSWCSYSHIDRYRERFLMFLSFQRAALLLLLLLLFLYFTSVKNVHKNYTYLYYIRLQ